MNKKIAKTWTDEQLIEAVKNSTCVGSVSKYLKNINGSGANNSTIKKHIKRLNLDTSHFKLSNRIGKSLKLIDDKDFFSKNEIGTGSIKKRIIEKNLKEYKCELCGITEWNDKPISLHLDHINGINNDHRLDNIRFLCPNCHSLTDNFAGKCLKGRKMSEHKCVDCGEDTTRKTVRCSKCYKQWRLNNKDRKINWPSTSALLVDIKEFGYEGTARKYSISSNTLKERIKKYPDYISTT